MDFQNPNLSKVLGMVGQKLGADPQTLQRDLKAGKYDSVLSKMKPNEAARLQQILNNPALAQQLLNTPQAQQMLKNIMGQANQKK
ncbi:MAG: hypothetical protein ACOX6P_10800 [Candidatus Merdivicinus sp.]|jgi:hypothetical protein